jgi:hypothetical protein
MSHITKLTYLKYPDSGTYYTPKTTNVHIKPKNLVLNQRRMDK